MKEIVAVTTGVAVVVGVVTALVFYANSMDVVVQRTFGPAQEEARRQTFESSRAYREGIAQEIESMQTEYVKGTPEQKDALVSVILHRVAGVKIETLPTHVQAFISQIRSERGL